jgi:hypothetical protein
MRLSSVMDSILGVVLMSAVVLMGRFSFSGCGLRMASPAVKGLWGPQAKTLADSESIRLCFEILFGRKGSQFQV